MTKIINLTPHPINIVGLGEIKPSGKPARLEEGVDNAGSITISPEENPNTRTEVVIPLIHKRMGNESWLIKEFMPKLNMEFMIE